MRILAINALCLNWFYLIISEKIDMRMLNAILEWESGGGAYGANDGFGELLGHLRRQFWKWAGHGEVEIID